jgi:hypothetical protein
MYSNSTEKYGPLLKKMYFTTAWQAVVKYLFYGLQQTNLIPVHCIVSTSHIGQT